MIIYEFTPSNNVPAIFRIAINTDNNSVRTKWHYVVNEYMERLSGLCNRKEVSESREVMANLKKFWNGFCKDEAEKHQREWTVTAVKKYIREHDEELYSFLNSKI